MFILHLEAAPPCSSLLLRWEVTVWQQRWWISRNDFGANGWKRGLFLPTLLRWLPPSPLIPVMTPFKCHVLSCLPTSLCWDLLWFFLFSFFSALAVCSVSHAVSRVVAASLLPPPLPRSSSFSRCSAETPTCREESPACWECDEFPDCWQQKISLPVFHPDNDVTQLWDSFNHVNWIRESSFQSTTEEFCADSIFEKDSLTHLRPQIRCRGFKRFSGDWQVVTAEPQSSPWCPSKPWF